MTPKQNFNPNQPEANSKSIRINPKCQPKVPYTYIKLYTDIITEKKMQLNL